MKCVICGSFRKFYAEVVKTISIFEHRGIKVLSPTKSKIINPGEPFVILESDQSLDIRAIELKHLDEITPDIEQVYIAEKRFILL